MLGWRGGGWGGLSKEGEAESGRRRALTQGAAVGALLWTDGLQHAALALLQHVLLWRKKEMQSAKQGQNFLFISR